MDQLRFKSDQFLQATIAEGSIIKIMTPVVIERNAEGAASEFPQKPNQYGFIGDAMYVILTKEEIGKLKLAQEIKLQEDLVDSDLGYWKLKEESGMKSKWQQCVESS